jgi:hypothetical protein
MEHISDKPEETKRSTYPFQDIPAKASEVHQYQLHQTPPNLWS